MAVFCSFSSSGRVFCVDSAEHDTIKDLKTYIHNTQGLPQDAYYIICNGVPVEDDTAVRENNTYRVCLRALGGKGGFGSMLRAIGAQIEKTTNHEACRDLSGRRMRDINNEKDLKEWLSKQSEREREREERRKERLARRRAMPNHKFDDPTYDKQRSLLAESQEEALITGLQKTQSASDSAGTKRKSETPGTSGGVKKKCPEWLGVDMSDIDSDEADDTPSSSDSHAEGSEQDVSNDSSVACSAGHQEEASDPVCGAAGSSALEVKSENTGTNRQKDELCDETEQSKGVTTEADSNTVEARPFCLEEVSAVQEIEALGLDRLKQELMDRSLKCGGTLQERAQRLLSVRGLTHDEIDPSLFAKAVKGKKVKNKK